MDGNTKFPDEILKTIVVQIIYYDVPWRWKQQQHLKYQYNSTRLHGVTSQITATVTAQTAIVCNADYHRGFF